jgi:hypothetical protein
MVRRWVILLFSFWLSNASFASEVAIFSSRSTFSTFEKNIIAQLPGASLVNRFEDVPSNTIMIGTGTKFFENIPVDFQNCVLAILPYPQDRQPPEGVMLLYYQVSPVQIAEFLQNQFGNLKVGFLYKGENSPFQKYNAEHPHSGITFIGQQAKSDVFDAIKQLRKRNNIDIFLVTNDTSIYQSGNLRFLLEDLYRQSIPVVALNANLLKAGATIALTPTPEGFATTARILIESIQDGGEIPHENYAEHMDIQINEKLAKRYSLILKNRSGNDEL